MANGQVKKVATPKAAGYFIVYKVQPTDKSLKQIAREQLADENLWDKIVLDRETANAKGFFWDEIPANSFDPRWTLLLPPSEFAAFTVSVNTPIHRAPNGEFLAGANITEKYFYARKTVVISGQKVWAEVTKTNPARFGNKPYWILVKDGTSKTNPPITGPS